MSRLRKMTGTLLAAGLLIGSSLTGLAQDAPADVVAERGQMASITLERVSLPDGYIFTGETFLTADQVASGDLTADDLTAAGFTTQYLSVYTNPDNGNQITSYVSAWTDAEAATAGFDLIEDESRTHPEGTFEDSDAGVGEAPGETTAGTWTDAGNSNVTIASIDTTFRMDRFLVGTSLQTRDGSDPDPAVVSALAGVIEARATSAVSGESPDGTDVALVPQALPLFVLAPSLQAGFLGPQDVEQMYGLQGSALGGLTAAWTDAVGIGDSSAPPYLAVGLTQFATTEDAQSVIDQFADLAPNVTGAEQIDGFALEGTDASVAFMFPGVASNGEAPDSFRIAAISDTTLIVIDVQGAATIEVAEATAIELAGAQLECLGGTSCAVPELRAELTGA